MHLFLSSYRPGNSLRPDSWRHPFNIEYGYEMDDYRQDQETKRLKINSYPFSRGEYLARLARNERK